MRLSRALISACFIATSLLGASAAQAQTQDKCAPPRLINAFQMTRSAGGDADLVPVAIGGKPLNFVLGTGSFLTMIGQSAADNLKLSIGHSDEVRTLRATGSGSQTEAVIPQFTLGAIAGSDTVFHIAPETDAANGAFVLQVTRQYNGPVYSLTDVGVDGTPTNGRMGPGGPHLARMNIAMDNNSTLSSTTYQTAANTKAYDGVFGLDLITAYDADIDFGTDKYQMFSPDHCPGAGVYWDAPAMAIVPILKADYGLHIPVKMDGQSFNALIDTSASVSTLREDVAKLVYGVSANLTSAQQAPAQDQAAGAVADVPAGATETVTVHGVRVVEHTFHTLTFEGVTVNNPHMVLVPYSSGFLLADTGHVTGSLIATHKEFLGVPEVTIGMDVLRKLHIYVAPKEGVIYISQASVPEAAKAAP